MIPCKKYGSNFAVSFDCIEKWGGPIETVAITDSTSLVDQTEIKGADHNK